MVDKQQLAAMGEHMREMEECKPEFKVPDGWKLVPTEPSEEMITSSVMSRIGAQTKEELDCNSGFWAARDCVAYYRLMIAAAPEYKP